MTSEIFGFKAPKESCTDRKCPFHGHLQVKDERFRGVVVRKDLNHSATISWFRSLPVPKYERFEVRRYRLRVHNPICLDIGVGDNVVVARTRPLSKTKNHVIIGKVEGGKVEAVSKGLLVAEEASRQERKPKHGEEAPSGYSKKEQLGSVAEESDESN